MHTNPAFRGEDHSKSIAAARAHGMGTLVMNGEAAPLVSHIPFLLHEDGRRVEAHLTRSNPILRALETPQTATLCIVLGTGYVSPDWYGLVDQVPTMNYIAVHLTGTLEAVPVDRLKPHLDRLSVQFETPLLPKTPWTSDKMSDGMMERMMRMILPIEMTVTGIESTWKLNQNKDAVARLGAADQIADPVIAAAMRAVD